MDEITTNQTRIENMDEDNFITIRYPRKPRSIDCVGCQHHGALCVHVSWSDEEGTIEKWEIGSFDPAIYPEMEYSPFDVWTLQS